MYLDTKVTATVPEVFKPRVLCGKLSYVFPCIAEDVTIQTLLYLKCLVFLPKQLPWWSLDVPVFLQKVYLGNKAFKDVVRKPQTLIFCWQHPPPFANIPVDA